MNKREDRVTSGRNVDVRIDRIIELRDKKGISQNELAKKANVTPAALSKHVSAYEDNGKKVAKMNELTVRKIANEFGVHHFYLRGLTDNPSDVFGMEISMDLFEEYSSEIEIYDAAEQIRWIQDAFSSDPELMSEIRVFADNADERNRALLLQFLRSINIFNWRPLPHTFIDTFLSVLRGELFYYFQITYSNCANLKNMLSTKYNVIKEKEQMRTERLKTDSKKLLVETKPNTEHISNELYKELLENGLINTFKEKMDIALESALQKAVKRYCIESEKK